MQGLATPPSEEGEGVRVGRFETASKLAALFGASDVEVLRACFEQ
jgi:hypothetical protein